MNKVHYTEKYLLDPSHKVTLNLVGMGGTGSLVLTHLARINEALTSQQHPGLHVTCWDDDTVSAANIGRQMFSPADLGENKAVLLVSRVNRFFGYSWEANPEIYTGQTWANITVTCVDTAAARIKIGDHLKAIKGAREPHYHPHYWLDMGNLATTGQVVLGSRFKIPQPKSEHKTAGKLKTVLEYFPGYRKIKEKDQGPSCSLAQAINRQDLFINSTLANFGAGMIWKLFREGMIRHQGCFVNLENSVVTPIPIK